MRYILLDFCKSKRLLSKQIQRIRPPQVRLQLHKHNQIKPIPALLQLPKIKLIRRRLKPILQLSLPSLTKHLQRPKIKLIRRPLKPILQLSLPSLTKQPQRPVNLQTLHFPLLIQPALPTQPLILMQPILLQKKV